MYVCLCNNVNDRAIRAAARQGAQDLEDLRVRLGVASQCGQCACMAEDLLAEELLLNRGRAASLAEPAIIRR